MAIREREITATIDTDVAWHAPPRWLPSTFHALAYRDFFLLWLAQITNSLSLWMEQVARPVLVLLVTGSEVHLGLVVAARGLPQLFMGPVAGVVADRFDRRVVILGSKVSGMAVNIVFAAIILTGQLELWHIYVTAVLRSMSNAFDNPARQALIPSLVPPKLVMNAFAVNSGSMQLVRIAAASVAGFSLALFGVGGTFGIVAAVSITPVIITYFMKIPTWARVEVRKEESWMHSMAEGFRFAWKEKIIFAILVLLAIQSIFGTPYIQVFVPILALKFLDFGFLSILGIEESRAAEVGLGLLLGASGVGALLGTVIIATIGERLSHRGLIVISGLSLYGLAICAMGISSYFPAILPFLFVMIVGIGQSMLMPVKNVLLMEYSPNEIRGRIMSLQSLDRGLTTLGSSGGGLLAALIGAPFAMALYGLAVVVGTVVTAIVIPALRRVD